MSNLKASELLSQLLAGEYVVMEKGKYVFTRKFYGEIGSVAIVPVTNTGLALMPVTQADWETQFINLIKEAQVPMRLEDTRGGVYSANKFSVEGLKVFRRAIESGVNYQVLVKSVMLYYKSSIKLKKAVGNYFTSGDWRTDYEALMISAQEGAESLKQHIKTETEDVTRSQYKLG